MPPFYRQIACIATALAVITGYARADAAVLETVSPVSLQKVLGSGVSIGELVGDTILEGEIDGIFYSVFFYSCDGGPFDGAAKPTSECLSFEYRAYFEDFPDDGETIAAFNAAHHFGALWRDQLADDALALHLPVIVEGGVAEGNIRATLRWWRETLRAFTLFMENR